MSYTFNVRSDTKQGAIEKVAEKMAGVIASQPGHAHDAEQLQQAAATFINLLADDESTDVCVNINGYVRDGLSVGFSVAVGLNKRAAA